jgi:hypothetical protein
MTHKPLWLAILLTCACAPHAKSDPPPPPTTSDAPLYLTPARTLVRISMALRGTRPSAKELDDVEQDPNALARIVDAYLESDAFGETLRDMHNESLLVRAERPDLYGGYPAVGKLARASLLDIARSVHEAPLRFIEHVVRANRPYTEIVTADYTMADAAVAAVWGLDYDGDGKEWKVAHWPDDRPRAGILSDPTLFLRHKSTDSNANRGRANRISKALLCNDFANREIMLDGSVDLSDPESIKNATVKNTACNGCHQTLDPLGSFFNGHYGFVVIGKALQDNPAYPIAGLMSSVMDGTKGGVALYDVASEGRWKTTTGRAPGYFGVPGNRLDDLGRLIAADPRFSLCTAKRFYAYLYQVETSAVAQDVAGDLQKAFVDGGFDVKALVRRIVLADDFRRVDVYGRATVEQLSRMVFDLAGFRWETTIPSQGTVDLTTNALYGAAILAGGIDSFQTVKPSRSTNATTGLFLRRFADETAAFVVDADFALPAEQRKLFGAIADGATDEASVRAALRALHRRLYGEVLDPAIDDGYGLFTHALDRARGDARRAWKITLSAMLQDPRLLYY